VWLWRISPFTVKAAGKQSMDADETQKKQTPHRKGAKDAMKDRGWQKTHCHFRSSGNVRFFARYLFTLGSLRLCGE
jgi:hypothetical protein